jgi:hypothetical protein
MDGVPCSFTSGELPLRTCDSLVLAAMMDFPFLSNWLVIPTQAHKPPLDQGQHHYDKEENERKG